MYISGLCHGGLVALPSGKYFCYVNKRVKFELANQTCQDLGFDRLLEIRTKEDSIMIAHLEACKYHFAIYGG